MNRTKNFIRLFLIALLFITGINAMVAGILFILYPSGSGLGMSTEYLKFTTFPDYLIPGWILLLTIGLPALFTAFLSIRKHRNFPRLLVLQGLLLCCWIITQVFMVSYFNFLHLIMLIFGSMMLAGGGILSGRENT